MTAQPSESFTIDAAHPALAGHFPGNPVVPGVVLLEQICAIIERQSGEPALRLTAVPRVKFLAVVRPGQRVEVAVAPSRQPLCWRFEGRIDGEVVAVGETQWAADRGVRPPL